MSLAMCRIQVGVCCSLAGVGDKGMPEVALLINAWESE